MGQGELGTVVAGPGKVNHKAHNKGTVFTPVPVQANCTTRQGYHGVGWGLGREGTKVVEGV